MNFIHSGAKGRVGNTTIPTDRPGRFFYMPLYRAGTVVMWNNQKHTISHVSLRHGDLVVHLNGKETAVKPESLQLQPSLFTTARKVEPLLPVM